MTALPCASVPELALADDLFAGLYQHAKRVTVRARHRSIQPGPLLFRGASDQQLTGKTREAPSFRAVRKAWRDVVRA